MKLTLPITLLSLFLSGSVASAALTIESVSGASRYYDQTDSNGNRIYRILGGMVGTTCTGTSVCDTCTGSGLTPCNETAVGTNTILRLRGKTTSTGNNRYGLLQLSTGTATTVKRSQNPVDGGGFFYIDVTWLELCGAMGNSSCASDASADFKFGVSEYSSDEFISGEVLTLHITLSNATARTYYTRCPEGGSEGTQYTGFCEFKVAPGDEKLYVDGDGESLRVSPSFPAASGTGDIKWKQLIFFFTEYNGSIGATLSSINNASSRFELPYSPDSEAEDLDPMVTGLSNGVRYCLLMANEDEAGNIASFTNFTGDPGYSGIGDAALESLVCGTPSLVVGLLDDKKCFIATAAWGSALDPHVSTLRKFRDQFLRTSRLGNRFIEAYYANSPRWAKWVRQSESAQMVVRGLLWPVVGFAWMSLKLGLGGALALLFGSLAAIGLVAKSGLSRSRRVP